MTPGKTPTPPVPGDAAYSSRIDVDRVDARIRTSVRAQVVEAIKNNPELALAIVRGWKDAGR